MAARERVDVGVRAYAAYPCVKRHVTGRAVGSRDHGGSVISWAFIDPELTVDPDDLVVFPEAKLLLIPVSATNLLRCPSPSPSRTLSS